MDLHSDNIYIKKLKKTKSIKYDILIDSKIHSFYVKTTHELKIIDFDGSQKSQIMNKSLKNGFKNKINNPESITGKSTKYTNRTNILKIIHTLLFENPKIKSKLIKFGIKSNKGIPFTKEFKFKESYNKNALNKYGLYIKNLQAKKIKFLKVNNNIVWNINKIMKTIIRKKIYQKQMDFKVNYSQIGLLL